MGESIRIRAARPEEFAACRMLLPPDMERSLGAEYVVAVQDEAPFIVGAASYVLETQATHRVRLRVIRTHRRQGIGTRLIAHIEDLSKQRGSRVLIGAADSIGELEAGPFLTALGFNLAGRAITVRALVESVVPIVLPLEERLLKRSRGAATVVPMAEAPINAVTALYKTELARSPSTTAWALLDAVSSPRFARCPVLLSADKVAGFLLFQIDGDVAVVHARIVAAEFKGGAANVLLMAAAVRISLPFGVRTIEFEVPEDNSDTEKLARRLAGQAIRTKDQYYRSIEPA